MTLQTSTKTNGRTIPDHARTKADPKQALSVAQRAVNADPSRPDQRTRLAALIVRGGAGEGSNLGNAENERLALSILTDVGHSSLTAATSSKIDMDVKATIDSLGMQAVAQAALSGENGDDKDGDALCKAQRAIMLRPSDMGGWWALAYVRARMANL